MADNESGPEAGAKGIVEGVKGSLKRPLGRSPAMTDSRPRAKHSRTRPTPSAMSQPRRPRPKKLAPPPTPTRPNSGLTKRTNPSATATEPRHVHGPFRCVGPFGRCGHARFPAIDRGT